MSAVYTPQDFNDLYNASFNAVITYVAANPGKSLEEIVTATGQKYELVYQICCSADMVILPNAGGELHWHGKP